MIQILDWRESHALKLHYGRFGRWNRRFFMIVARHTFQAAVQTPHGVDGAWKCSAYHCMRLDEHGIVVSFNVLARFTSRRLLIHDAVLSGSRGYKCTSLYDMNPSNGASLITPPQPTVPLLSLASFYLFPTWCTCWRS